MLGGLCIGACCDGEIAYDAPAEWSQFHRDVWPDKKAVVGVGANPSKLTSRVKLMFAGNHAVCADATRFMPESSWPAIRNWIFNGGRLWFQTEYEGCLVNPAKATAFIEYMSATIFREGGIQFNGNNCQVGGLSTTIAPADCVPAIDSYPNGARIAQGSVFRVALTESLDFSPNPVWLVFPSGNCCTQVDQLGVNGGFFFVHGDSNSSECWRMYNKPFFRKLLDTPDDEVI